MQLLGPDFGVSNFFEVVFSIGMLQANYLLEYENVGFDFN